MAAIPRDLMESGTVRPREGAFTGANTRRAGRFEQADGGTLFLDEIGDMPAKPRPACCGVLSDGEFYRVGGHVPVRKRAHHRRHPPGTWKPWWCNRGFSRGPVPPPERHPHPHTAPVPAPRGHPRLMQYFFQRAAEELGGDPKILLPETEKFLTSLEWPGNVRQLETPAAGSP